MSLILVLKPHDTGITPTFLLDPFDPNLGHPALKSDPQDADFSSEPHGKMGSNPRG